MLTTWLASPAADLLGPVPWLPQELRDTLRSYLAQPQWWPTPLHSVMGSYATTFDVPLSWTESQAGACRKILEHGRKKREDEVAREVASAGRVRHIGYDDLADLIGPTLLDPSAASHPE